MTDQLSPLAVQNAELLRAIAAGPHPSRLDLAGAANVVPNNLNRKLASLLAEGLIESDGVESHQVALTDLAQRALNAMDLFEGKIVAALEPSSVLDVRVDRIGFSALNPRKSYDAAGIAELARSIADKGILQPLVVRPANALSAFDFELVIGERRLRAARHAVEHAWVSSDFAAPVRVRELTDDEAFEVAGVENLQREDLHWIEEAEFYRTLAERGRSAAQIIRLVGAGGRKKRSIQELIQFARELDDDAKARCRLPEGDPRCITVNQARFMVGNKRPQPALDLTPKLAATLLELLLAADCAGGEPGDTMEAILHAKPVGGAMITLSDRALIKLRVSGGTPTAIIPITEDMAKYLHQVGYNDDPLAAVNKARADVIGDLAAGALAADGRYLTDELNTRETAWTPPRAEGDHNGHDDHEGGDNDTLSELEELVLYEVAHRIWTAGFERAGTWNAWVSRDFDFSSSLDKMMFVTTAGVGQAINITPRGQQWLLSQGFELLGGRCHISDDTLAVKQEATGRAAEAGVYVNAWLNQEPQPAGGALINSAKPAPKPTVPELTDDAALIVLELAHKIAAEAMPGDPLPSAVIDPSYRNDAMSNQLVFDRLIMFRMMGAETAVALTPTAHAWLDHREVERDARGLHMIDEAALQYLQMEAGREPVGLYVTPWLQTKKAEPAPPARARDAFMEQVLASADEAGKDAPEPPQDAMPDPMVGRLCATLTRLMAATRTVEGLLLSGQTRKLKPDETKASLALIEAALADADRDLLAAQSAAGQ